MPNYDYECKYCNHVYESQRTIKNRKVPQNECCPSCQNAGLVKLKVGSASIVDSIRLGAAPPMASYAAGGLVGASAQLPAPSVEVKMQTFAVPSRAQFRKWYKGSVAPNVRKMGRRGQLR